MRGWREKRKKKYKREKERKSVENLQRRVPSSAVAHYTKKLMERKRLWQNSSIDIYAPLGKFSLSHEINFT